MKTWFRASVRTFEDFEGAWESSVEVFQALGLLHYSLSSFSLWAGVVCKHHGEPGTESDAHRQKSLNMAIQHKNMLLFYLDLAEIGPKDTNGTTSKDRLQEKAQQILLKDIACLSFHATGTWPGHEIWERLLSYLADPANILYREPYLKSVAHFLKELAKGLGGEGVLAKYAKTLRRYEDLLIQAIIAVGKADLLVTDEASEIFEADKTKENLKTFLENTLEKTIRIWGFSKTVALLATKEPKLGGVLGGNGPAHDYSAVIAAKAYVLLEFYSKQ